MKKKNFNKLNLNKKSISKLSKRSVSKDEVVGGSGHMTCIRNTIIFDECLTSYDYECWWSNQTVDPNDSPRLQ